MTLIAGLWLCISTESLAYRYSLSSNSLQADPTPFNRLRGPTYRYGVAGKPQKFLPERMAFTRDEVEMRVLA